MCPRANNLLAARRRRARLIRARLAPALSIALASAPIATAQQRTPGVADLPLAPGTSAERMVERFLQEHGLASLLAEQLSQRLEASSDESRARIAEKLARVYALLLESPLDAAQRRRLEAQSQRLLDRLPAADAIDLQLTLLRSAYAQAERTAERWLLGLAEETERHEAVALLAQQGRAFEAIADDANVRIRTLEEQEGSLDGALARRIAQRLAEERSRRSLARYLAAWAHTYHALLTGSRESASRGAGAASRVLGAETTDVEPDDLSDRLLRYEHVARAAVAAALCHAALGDAASALDWLAGLEQSESAPATVRAELPARRGLALALLDRWSAVRELIEEAPELSPTAMRLLAAQALAAVERGDNSAQRAAEAALAKLVRAGSVGHVLDLATRFGVEALPEGGFVALYVRGVAAHREAAQLEEREPARARTLHEQAADLVRRALEARDAVRFAGAEHDAAMIAGASLLRAARIGSERAAAATWFERAARATGDRARQGEALWGAIAALSGAAGSEKRAELIERFLRDFVDHPRYAAVALEQAQLPGVDPVEAAADLLRVDAADPLARTARAAAANLLFDALRAARGAEQAALAQQYLHAATPLLMQDAVDAEAGDAAAASRALARARRALEAAFVADPPRIESAERALQVVDALAALGSVDLAGARGELDERRVRLLAARRRLDEALDLVDAMRQRAQREGAVEQAWARSAAAAIARNAVDAWRNARSQGDSGEMRDAAQRLLRAVEQGLRPSDDAAGAAMANALAPDVAEAAFHLWQTSQDQASLRAAQRANEMVLASAPSDRAALRRKGLLAQARDDAQAALEAWRTLAAGLPPASQGWFEARAGVIEALAFLNPQRAREALAQHAAMHPDLGPEPWRSRLREIAAKLGVELTGRPGGGG